MAASKPCRLEMNNSGAWKLIARFDAADSERTDELMNAAAQLADAVNEGESRALLTLRVSTDEEHPKILMRYDQREGGWRDHNGAPA